jgi:hypothetical protein
MKDFRYPSATEIAALERAARRARAEEMVRVAKVAVAGIRSLFARPDVHAKEARHA